MHVAGAQIANDCFQRQTIVAQGGGGEFQRQGEGETEAGLRACLGSGCNCVTSRVMLRIQRTAARPADAVPQDESGAASGAVSGFVFHPTEDKAPEN